MTAMALPPGSLGLPWIGESIPFVRDPVAFLRSRHERYGPVFKTRIEGKLMLCFAGAEGLRFFYDPRYFTRAGASLVQLTDLLHPDAVAFLDRCPRHAARRALIMQAYAEDALAGYLPIIDRTVCRYLQRWETLGSFAWLPELKAMCFDIVSFLLAQADRDPGGERPLVASLDCQAMGVLTPPIRLPFTRFGRATAARDELRAYIRERVAEAGDAEGTVLGRFRAARTADGVAMSAEELEIELLHFVFGAFGAIVGALAGLVLQLGDHPEVRARAAGEVRSKLHGGAFTPALLDDLPYLTQVLKEVRRITPLIASTFFARVTRGCEFAGYRIPEGALALGSLHATLHDASLFPQPDVFDPERFGPERAEDACDFAFVPHGGGSWLGHRCAGQRLAELMMHSFAARLLRDYTWELPSQDRSLDGRGIVPFPRNGIPVRFGRA